MIIHWWSLAIIYFVCFMVGGFVGAAVMALCAIAKEPAEPNDFNQLSIRLDKLFDLLLEIKRKEDKFMSEVGDALSGISVQLGKAKDEIVKKITDLEVALANAGTIPADVQTAIDALKVQAQALDDIVPDVPTP